MEDRSIGIDIGGSNIRAAVCDRSGGERLYLIEPILGHRAEDLLAQIDSLLQRCITAAGGPVPIGVAIPAPVNPHDGTHGTVFNVAALNQMDLCAELRRRHGVRVVADNDANAAALAQVRHGRHQGVRNLVYVTVSTSIGAGVIASGRLVHGVLGGAGEFGHTSVSMNDVQCYECKRNHGCVTSFASGTGLVWRADRLRASGGLPDGSPLQRDPLTAADIARAAADGDPHATALITQAALALGTATVTLVHLLNPEVIAFGGSVIQNIDTLWEQFVHITTGRCMPQLAGSFRLERVPEGDKVGVIGASALVWEA
jgi:glucokinase